MNLSASHNATSHYFVNVLPSNIVLSFSQQDRIDCDTVYGCVFDMEINDFYKSLNCFGALGFMKK